MKKDVIYIDVEDDITAIIDKLKSSGEKIVALVPPKGNPVLQSTVNLKLLKRAANTAEKRPVIVTNNNALLALAGSLEMYAAKNLQSKPYIPTEEDAATANEDAVDVSQPVGAAAAGAAVGSTIPLKDTDEMEVNADDLAADLESDKADSAGTTGKKDKKTKKKGENKSGKKVPNFNSFKKKLVIFGGAALVLLVAAFFLFFRPSAEITVRAETTPAEISYEAKISDSGASEPENYVFRAVTQTDNKSVSESFDATGKKDVGKKATGSMTLTRTSVSSTPISVPAGTTFTSGSVTFVSTEGTTLAGTSIGPGGLVQDSKTVDVQASESGDEYNVSARSYQPSKSGFDADGSQMTGGTSKVVSVVSQSDVNKATDTLKKKDYSDIKAELENGFPDDVTVLTDSFSIDVGQITSEPAVGQEASSAKLTAQVSYSMLALKNDELKKANEKAIEDEMDNKDQQQVYKDGVEGIDFEKVKIDGTTATYTVSAVGQYGPKIDTEALANEVANKKVGEVRSIIQDIPGVKSTDINIAPFWSRSTPGAEKIQIKLDVDETAAG